MKIILFFLFLTSLATVDAKEFILSDAQAEYTVKHLLKTVKGENKDLKGKMVCQSEKCDFLIAFPSKSFVSSDSNRDLNMQTILEVGRYPVITVKGSLAENELSKENYQVKTIVSFHGVEKEYLLSIRSGVVSQGQVTILLEDHKVERPSLLLAKIENEVPVSFNFKWKDELKH